MKIKLLIATLLLSYPHLGLTQTNVKKKERIHFTNLLGKWTCAESKVGVIEFVKEHNNLIIKPKVVIGSYTFRIDSNGLISPQGYAPNWPPYYCRIEYTGRANINIHYWHLGYKGHTYAFQKN